MSKRCDSKNCVSKKKYNDLLVENKALKEKITALEMGKLPVQYMSDSDSYSSGDFESPIEATRIVATRATMRRGGKKKKNSKGKRKKGKTKRMRG